MPPKPIAPSRPADDFHLSKSLINKIKIVLIISVVLFSFVIYAVYSYVYLLLFLISFIFFTFILKGKIYELLKARYNKKKGLDLYYLKIEKYHELLDKYKTVYDDYKKQENAYIKQEKKRLQNRYDHLFLLVRGQLHFQKIRTSEERKKSYIKYENDIRKDLAIKKKMLFEKFYKEYVGEGKPHAVANILAREKMHDSIIKEKILLESNDNQVISDRGWLDYSINEIAGTAAYGRIIKS